MAQLGNDDIKAFLNLIQTHSKDDSGQRGGGGDPTDSTSAQQAQPSNSAAFINWLNGIGSDVKSAAAKTSNAFQTGYSDLDNYLAKQPINGIPGAPDLGSLAGIINSSMPGANPNMSADKSPLGAAGALAMLGIGGEEGDEDTAPEEGATASTPKSPVRVTLKPSVYGAGREADVQKTVDTEVPGTTATEKYANLEPTMSKLGDQINGIMQQNPKSASLDQVMKDYDANLKDQGVYRTAQASKDDVQKTARGYISDLQNEAEGENKGAINPSKISDVGLQKIKQSINKDASSVFKKLDNGTSLTDKDKVILAGRQTVDDTLSNLHPDIKELTNKQSHLYDAADPLFKAREAEIKNAPVTQGNWADQLRQNNPTLYNALVAKPNAMKAIDKDPSALSDIGKLSDILSGKTATSRLGKATQAVTRGVNGIASHPLASIIYGGLTGIAGTGLYGLDQLVRSSLGPKTIVTANGQTASFPGLQNIKDARGSAFTTNYDQYKNGVTDINTKLNAIDTQLSALNTQKQAYTKQAEAGFYPAKGSLDNLNLQEANLNNQKDQLNNQLNSLTTAYKPSIDIINTYNKNQNIVGGLAKAQKELAGAPPNILSAFPHMGPITASIRSSIWNGYSSYDSTLNYLKSQGVDTSTLENAATPQAALGAMESLIQSYTNQTKIMVQNSGGVWPGGKSNNPQSESINQSINTLTGSNSGINTGSPTLDNILSPTPQPPSPTPTNAPEPQYKPLVPAQFGY